MDVFSSEKMLRVIRDRTRLSAPPHYSRRPPLIEEAIHHIYGTLKEYLQHMVEKPKERQDINTLKKQKKWTGKYRQHVRIRYHLLPSFHMILKRTLHHLFAMIVISLKPLFSRAFQNHFLLTTTFVRFCICMQRNFNESRIGRDFFRGRHEHIPGGPTAAVQAAGHPRKDLSRSFLRSSS